jgi:hypothetical protein
MRWVSLDREAAGSTRFLMKPRVRACKLILEGCEWKPLRS